jgi:hypothetical protein
MRCSPVVALPLNIQVGLKQILWKFDDDEILEIDDCDMLHFRPSPVTQVAPNTLLVSDVYERWHLASLTTNRHVIEPYFENGGKYYNGGFVPIIGRVKTFKKILPEWIAVHIDILCNDHPETIKWWAGMFALQAACEKAKVSMIEIDSCYAPPANEITSTQFVGHYAVDRLFDKRTFPQVDVNDFEDNPYYEIIREWLKHVNGGVAAA